MKKLFFLFVFLSLILIGASPPVTEGDTQVFIDPVQMASDLEVLGTTSLGTLSITGPMTFPAAVNFNDTTSHSGTATFNAEVVNGLADFNGSANFDGVSIFNNTATFNDTTSTSGTATFKAITTNGTSDFNSLANFDGSTVFNGMATFNDTSSFSGTITANSLTANGLADFNGLSTFNTGSTFNSSVNFNDTTSTSGTATFNAETVNGVATFNGAVYLNGLPYITQVGPTIKTDTVSTADITLYVRTDGSDSNTCTTDSPSGACLTIQAAIDKIPTHVKHNVTVSVGAGTFAGFCVFGRTIELNGKAFTIQGADYANFTPATGTGSGTSDGGSTQTLSDSGQSWTVNDLRGKLIYVNSEYLVIRKNDATSLETVGASTATMSGKAYVFKDWTTTLNAIPSCAPSSPTQGVIEFFSNFTSILTSHVTRFKISIPSSKAGVHAFHTAAPRFTYISTSGGAYGIYLQSDLPFTNRVQNSVFTTFTSAGFYGFANGQWGTCKNILAHSGTSAYGGIALYGSYYMSSMDYFYADSNTGRGIVIDGTLAGWGSYWYASGNSDIGISLSGIQDFRLVSLTVESNLTGIALGGNLTTKRMFNASLYIGPATISSNTGDGIEFDGPVNIRLTSVTGTGNGAFGIDTRYGSKIAIDSGTTVTGTSGDLTINGGTDALTWSGNFAADGDSAVNTSSGTIVFRKDSM